MSNNTLSGQVTGEMALRLLPMIKKVEIVAQGSQGQDLRLKYAKNQAFEFLKENPETPGRIEGENLILIP